MKGLREVITQRTEQEEQGSAKKQIDKGGKKDSKSPFTKQPTENKQTTNKTFEQLFGKSTFGLFTFKPKQQTPQSQPNIPQPPKPSLPGLSRANFAEPPEQEQEQQDDPLFESQEPLEYQKNEEADRIDWSGSLSKEKKPEEGTYITHVQSPNKQLKNLAPKLENPQKFTFGVLEDEEEDRPRKKVQDRGWSKEEQKGDKQDEDQPFVFQPIQLPPPVPKKEQLSVRIPEVTIPKKDEPLKPKTDGPIPSQQQKFRPLIITKPVTLLADPNTFMPSKPNPLIASIPLTKKPPQQPQPRNDLQLAPVPMPAALQHQLVPVPMPVTLQPQPPPVPIPATSKPKSASPPLPPPPPPIPYQTKCLNNLLQKIGDGVKASQTDNEVVIEQKVKIQQLERRIVMMKAQRQKMKEERDRNQKEIKEIHKDIERANKDNQRLTEEQDKVHKGLQFGAENPEGKQPEDLADPYADRKQQLEDVMKLAQEFVGQIRTQQQITQTIASTESKIKDKQLKQQTKYSNLVRKRKQMQQNKLKQITNNYSLNKKRYEQMINHHQRLNLPRSQISHSRFTSGIRMQPMDLSSSSESKPEQDTLFTKLLLGTSILFIVLLLLIHTCV